jgi:nucleoid DNA-binding protein
MKFKDAFTYLKNGNAIKLPEWVGSWQWDVKRKTIIMHLKTGELLDIKDSPDMDFTLSFMFRDDWVLIDKDG